MGIDTLDWDEIIQELKQFRLSTVFIDNYQFMEHMEEEVHGYKRCRYMLPTYMEILIALKNGKYRANASEQLKRMSKDIVEAAAYYCALLITKENFTKIKSYIIERVSSVMGVDGSDVNASIKLMTENGIDKVYWRSQMSEIIDNLDKYFGPEASDSDIIDVLTSLEEYSEETSVTVSVNCNKVTSAIRFNLSIGCKVFDVDGKHTIDKSTGMNLDGSESAEIKTVNEALNSLINTLSDICELSSVHGDSIPVEEYKELVKRIDSKDEVYIATEDGQHEIRVRNGRVYGTKGTSWRAACNKIGKLMAANSKLLKQVNENVDSNIENKSIEYIYNADGTFNDKCVFKSLNVSKFKLVESNEIEVNGFEDEFRQLGKLNHEDYYTGGLEKIMKIGKVSGDVYTSKEYKLWAEHRYERNYTDINQKNIRDYKAEEIIKGLGDNYREIAEQWLDGWMHGYATNKYNDAIALRRFLLRAFNNADVAIDRQEIKLEEKLVDDFEKFTRQKLESLGNYDDLHKTLDEFMIDNKVQSVHMFSIKNGSVCAKLLYKADDVINNDIGHCDITKSSIIDLIVDIVHEKLKPADVKDRLKNICDEVLSAQVYKPEISVDEIYTDENVDNLMGILKNIDSKARFISRITDNNWFIEICNQLWDEEVLGSELRLWNHLGYSPVYGWPTTGEGLHSLVRLYVYTKQGLIETSTINGDHISEEMQTLEGIERAIEKEIRLKLEQMIYGHNTRYLELGGTLRDMRNTLGERGLEVTRIAIKSSVDLYKCFVSCIKNLLRNCDTEFGYMPTRWEICEKVCRCIRFPEQQCKIELNFDYKGLEFWCEQYIDIAHEFTYVEPASTFDNVMINRHNVSSEDLYAAYALSLVKLSSYDKPASMALEMLGNIVKWNRDFGSKGSESGIDKLRQELVDDAKMYGITLGIKTIDGEYELLMDGVDIWKNAGIPKEKVCTEIARVVVDAGYADALVNWTIALKYKRIGLG